MKQSQGVDIFFCAGYPFNDNSNVFDYAMNNHKIAEFVEKYTLNDVFNPIHTADFDISSGVVTIRLADYDNGNLGRTFGKLQTCNYMKVVFYNSSQIYYCFINNVKCDNNQLTATIHFTIDIWNTYRPRFDFKNSFIEREHVENDTKFKHVIDEGLAPSQYYVNHNITPTAETFNNYGYVVGLSDATYIMAHHDTTSYVQSVYNTSKNIYTGLLVAVPNNDTLIRLLSVYQTSGKTDAITGVYLMPNDVISNVINTPAELRYYTPDDVDQQTPIYYPVTVPSESSSVPTPHTTTIAVPTGFTVNGENYAPVNNKLYCYPYSLCRITNHLGNELNLHYEKSTNSNHSISVCYSYESCINGCCYVSIQNYDGISGVNADYMLKGMDYPTVPYAINSFYSWYSANRNMLSNQQIYIDKDYEFNMSVARAETSMSETSNAYNSIMGILSGGITGEGGLFGLANYASSQQSLYNQSVIRLNTLNYNYGKSIDSFLASLNDKALVPNKISGLNVPNALLLFDKNEFVATAICPSIEEIKAIDNYFSKYGYKVNRFDDIEYYRPRFDFKKCPDCNIVGNVPTDVINTIRGLFQQGITIWHDSENIYVYSLNSPLSPPPQPPQPR